MSTQGIEYTAYVARKRPNTPNNPYAPHSCTHSHTQGYCQTYTHAWMYTCIHILRIHAFMPYIGVKICFYCLSKQQELDLESKNAYTRNDWKKIRVLAHTQIHKVVLIVILLASFDLFVNVCAQI